MSKELWLKWWSDVDGGQLARFLGVYLALPIINCIAIGGFVWSFLIDIAPSSANKLHFSLLRTIMRSVPPPTFILM